MNNNAVCYCFVKTNVKHVFIYFLAFDFSIPATTVNDLRLRRIFYPRFYPLQFVSYLISTEKVSISLFNVECQTRALLVPLLYRLCYDAVLDWGVNPGPPALEALYH